MPTTGSSKMPYPNASDTPDGPLAILTLAQRIELIASGWTLTPSASTRAALVTNGDAYEGLHVYQIDTGIEYIYKSAAWSAVTPVSGAFRKSAAQNLTASAVALVLDVELQDTYGMHDNVTNNTRMTAPVAGLYEVTAMLFNSNTSGLGTAYGRLNGTTDIPGSLDRRVGDASASCPLHLGFSLVLAVNDYVEIMVLHASAAGTIAGGTTQGAAVVTMKKIG